MGWWGEGAEIGVVIAHGGEIAGGRSPDTHQIRVLEEKSDVRGGESVSIPVAGDPRATAARHRGGLVPAAGHFTAEPAPPTDGRWIALRDNDSGAERDRLVCVW